MAKPERPPKLNVALVPTPIEEYGRIRTGLWVKRDDLTGCELSGNKVRKLEYLVADALRQGCDVLLTAGAVQSNHARSTAALGARLGLEVVVILEGPADAGSWAQGNALLDRLFGARIVWNPREGELTLRMQEEAQRLRRRGRRPYVIPIGGSNALGAWGYVDAAWEAHRQVEELGLRIHRLVCAVGSCGTLVGLLCGVALARWKVEVTGINISSTLERKRPYLRDRLQEAADYFGLKIEQLESCLQLFDYAGQGYGKSTPEELRFIARVARTTGLLLDPVYTGKALYGLLDLHEKGVIPPEENILFFHTGGLLGLVAMGSQFDDLARPAYDRTASSP
jgi:L-cysteate sulfo-lyase